MGRRVDDVLQGSDVRLTMGGEPTFVSIDDMEGAEWNVAALGANKRKLAGTLFRRLAGRFAKGPLLHFGQGKWYPGESLPRWALSCYWRKDGQPIWHQPELIAEDDRDYGVGVAEAEAFMTTLAQRLGLSREFILPAYEDAWYYLWKERRLPVNVDPLESQLDDPEARATLARVFEQGLGRVAGYVAARSAAADRSRIGVGERPLVPAKRTDVPPSRRFAAGIPAAAGFHPLGRRRGCTADLRGGPDGAPRTAAGLSASCLARRRSAPPAVVFRRRRVAAVVGPWTATFQAPRGRVDWRRHRP